MGKHFNLDKRWCRTVVGAGGLVVLFLLSCILKLYSANRYQVAGSQSGNAVERLVDNLTSYDQHTIKYHYFRYENTEALDAYIKPDSQSHHVADCDVVLREYYYDGVNIRAKFEVSNEEGDEAKLNQFGLHDLFFNSCNYVFLYSTEEPIMQVDVGEDLFNPIVGNTKTIFYNAKLPVPVVIGKEGTPDILYLMNIADMAQGDARWEANLSHVLAEYPLEITADRFVYEDIGVKIVITPMCIEWMVYNEMGQSEQKVTEVSFYTDGKEKVLLEGHENVHDSVGDYAWEEGSHDGRWYSSWSYSFKDVVDLKALDYAEVTREDGSKVKLELE